MKETNMQLIERLNQLKHKLKKYYELNESDKVSSWKFEQENFGWKSVLYPSGVRLFELAGSYWHHERFLDCKCFI